MHLPELDKDEISCQEAQQQLFNEGIGQFTRLFVNFCLKSLIKCVNSFKNEFLRFRTAFSLVYFYQKM